ncbi:ERAD-associated protein [Xanthoria calcicola]
MKVRLLHLTWALCLFSGVAHALFERTAIKKNLPQTEAGGNPAAAAPESTESVAKWQQGGKDNGSQASVAVQEALSILRNMRTPKNRLARLEETSGFVGTSIYYAKEAFFFLFMNGPRTDDYLQTGSSELRLSKPLAEAVQLLEGAAKEREPDALFLLAEMNFFGNYTHPRNYKEAFRRYNDLASLNGNGSAQHMIGFMYATGIGDAVGRDQAKALMYHTFAALGGNTKSQMTAAYRHHSGIGTPRNCNEAAYWYKHVADKAIAFSRSGPPGGQIFQQKHVYRLADENGGVYGEGASVVSSGLNANKAGPNSDSHANIDDVLEYLDLMSRKGDLKATFSLGTLHYDGTRTTKHNWKTARAYFRIVARKYWARDGSVLTEDHGIGRVASKAAGYLGRMSLRGEGMEQSFEKALVWFKRGLANGDALCQYELGLMYLNGFGVRKDPVTAADYFKEAANQDFTSAQSYLGQLFLDQGDVSTAIRYFDLAARHGHIEAFYHLAEISNNGIGRERSCGVATAYYKLVAEKAENIHSSFPEANEAYNDGDSETALVKYMMAAEQGYESAQANVAYILDEYKSIFSLDSLLPWKKKRSSLLQNTVLALIYWTRSAKQSNIDSMVKMGDYYLSGQGVEADMEKAAACYQTAAETHQSAQARWNLGWIHENGLGVEQDFHLAKRFYDQALETNQEAYLPVKMSLMKLRLRSFWNTITRGKVNSIQPDPKPNKKDFSFNEWLSNFLEDPHPYYHGAEDDDFPDPSPENDYMDDIDESIVESLVILGLAGALAFLVYYRQQRQNHHRREMERQQQQSQTQQQQGADQGPEQPAATPNAPVPGQQADGGFFPAPDDPNFGQWVAGGVGH